MPFKIVKTIEDDIVKLTSVPSAWERDGALYWPPKGFKDGDKLIKDPESVPRIDWVKMPCTVKEADIESLNTANKLLKLYLNLEDTDAEIEYFQTQNERRPNKQLRKIFAKTQTARQTNNYNSEFEVIDDEIENNQAKEIVLAGNSAVLNLLSLPLDENELLVATENTINNNENAMFVMSYDKITSSDVTAQAATANKQIGSKLDVLAQKIDALDIKLDFFIKSYAELKSLLVQAVQNKNRPNNPTDNQDVESIITEFVFPLNDPKKVDELEQELVDKEFQNKTFKQFYKIAGTSRKQDGEKVAGRLMKELFSNVLLCQYTWKGISTSKSDEHRPSLIFIKYGNILGFLFSVLEKADKTFTRLALEKFLQYKIFKRDTQRLKRENLKKSKLSVEENNEELLRNEQEQETEIEEAIPEENIGDT